MIIGEKEVQLKLTGEVLLTFKETFNKDFFVASANFLQNGALTDALDMIYAFAKADDPRFMSYKEYMRTIHIGDLVGAEGQAELLEALNEGLSTTKEIKKKEQENQTNR